MSQCLICGEEVDISQDFCASCQEAIFARDVLGNPEPMKAREALGRQRRGEDEPIEETPLEDLQDNCLHEVVHDGHCIVCGLQVEPPEPNDDDDPEDFLDPNDIRNHYIGADGAIDSNRLAQDVNRLLALMLREIERQGWNTGFGFRAAVERIKTDLYDIHNPPDVSDKPE
jgi:hypothetical protein